MEDLQEKYLFGLFWEFERLNFGKLKKSQTGVVVHVCNPGSSGGSQVRGQPRAKSFSLSQKRECRQRAAERLKQWRASLASRPRVQIPVPPKQGNFMFYECHPDCDFQSIIIIIILR
jgi:hypothetical protein